MKERLSLTPGTPRFTARRIEDPEDKVNTQDHEINRSGVGTLLYLTKHSRRIFTESVKKVINGEILSVLDPLAQLIKLIRVSQPQGCLEDVL